MTLLLRAPRTLRPPLACARQRPGESVRQRRDGPSKNNDPRQADPAIFINNNSHETGGNSLLL